MSLRDKAATTWRELAWFVNGVLGANKYQQYLAHHRRHGHGAPMTEREFWRAESDRSVVEDRCC